MLMMKIPGTICVVVGKIVNELFFQPVPIVSVNQGSKESKVIHGSKDVCFPVVLAMKAAPSKLTNEMM